ncbi:MAG: hypothetical protein JXQ23_13315 [Clostridia bacterium]|nr:hypothetical protein [Clostridia bacterium]
MAGIYLNEDNSHYFFTRGSQAAERKEIEDFINQYKGSNVEVMLLSPNCQITSFKSKVWDCLSDRIDSYQDYFIEKPTMKDWAYAVKDLIDKDIDIYAKWIDLLRKINIKPYITVRMNDVHNANDVNDILHSSFYKDNLNYRRAMYRDSGWEDRQLNYLIKEVRDYHMALIEEYFERYDFDGIELDWMRFGNHFPTGYADEGRLVLNEFMRQVRKTADSYEKIRGHKIVVGARCPVKPDTAFDLGMDAVHWAKKGYIDFVAPSPFWQTSQADIPVELWKYLLDGTGCLVTPCFEVCLRPYINSEYKSKEQFNSLETLTGPACSFIDRGADAIYFFNYMDRSDAIIEASDYCNMINIIGKYDDMKILQKRYIVTFNDRKPDGHWLDIMLPKKLDTGVFTEYRVHTGNMKDRKEKYVVTAFKDNDDIKDSDLKVYVNGYLCTFAGEQRYRKSFPVGKLFKWEVPEQAYKSGYQVIEYVASTENLTLDWVEMLVY